MDVDAATQVAPLAAHVHRLLLVAACGQALVRQNPPGLGRSGYVSAPCVVLSELRRD